MYSYKILEQSRQNILILEDIKNYARISTSNDDKLLESMIDSAIQIAENFIKSSLIKKWIEVESDNAMNIRLPFAPIIKITSITADEVEMNPENVKIEGGVLSLAECIECTKLKITYITGPGDVILIPAPIIQGIMLHIASMYDARGSGAAPLDNVFALYRPYRKIIL